MKLQNRMRSKNVIDKRTPFGIPDRSIRTPQHAAIQMADRLGGNIKDSMRAPTRSGMKLGNQAGLSGMEDAARRDLTDILYKKYSGKGSKLKRKRTGGP